MSFVQERLWFLDQLEPGNPVYNLASAYRLTGRLDIVTLERSLNEIGRRHEALRMIFPSTGGKPDLIVCERLPLALKVVDLRTLGPTPQETVIKDLILDEVKLPFDLARGPLVRVCVFQLRGDDCVLLVIMHKIISDAASFGVFFRELLLIYAAFADGRCPPLPDLPMRHTEYSRRQRGLLEEGSLEGQRGYWKKHLANCPPTLHLATDSPRQSKRTYRAATYRTCLSQSLSMALRDLSQQQQASLFVLFLAAFKVLLHRYTEQDDIVVGSTVRGRTQPGCESLIGCFEQSLPLRTDLSGDPDFSELLSRVNQTTGEGFSNQDFPFEELLKELQVDRDLSQEPLFQVRFQLQVVDTISITPPELKLAVLELETGMTQYDLALGVIEQSQGFHCHFHYNQDLFEAATIARMAGHFQTLLESIVANPEEKISLLPLLTDGERQQLVKEWNEIRVKAQETAFSYELFEAQVSRRPDSPALTFESKSLTYRELDQRVNQLAQYLQTLGIRPEVLVGICMERSIELVVSVLAIHKAGGACLPLDPGLPDTRMTFMLEASCSPVILTEEKFLKKLSTLDVRVVCLDTIQGALKQQKKEPPLSELIEQNLSHVFYTSGSTGEPKAVMWNQSKQSKHQTWTQKTFRLTEDDRYLMKSAIGFTPLTSEIFWSLLSGAHLIVAPPGTDQDSRELVRLIAEHQITVIILVPSMLEAILEEPELEKCDSLRQVICFGETLSGELEERFLARFSANLNVIYGVTEAPGATYRICRRGQPYSAVNIGRRLPTRQVYVLDSRLQLTPIGVPGEICIGGESLARGYVNRPDLTAEKFIPNPFGFSPGARIYRTGDRARYLSDGSLEFLGRMDHQVKIRGYRIELAEIESALENHPDVQRAVAVVREERLGEKCLVAYVVLKPVQSHPVSKLRSFLKQKLPDYMIPSAFVILGKLPLTPAGKVDRRALPVPDAGRPELGASYMAPRTPVEEKLTKIWGEVLGVERVGVQDDFFELGGHSLLATQVMSRVRRAFQAEIPLRVLFEVPTVEGLAVAVVEALAEKLDPGEITHLFS